MYLLCKSIQGSGADYTFSTLMVIHLCFRVKESLENVFRCPHCLHLKRRTLHMAGSGYWRTDLIQNVSLSLLYFMSITLLILSPILCLEDMFKQKPTRNNRRGFSDLNRPVYYRRYGYFSIKIYIFILVKLNKI